MVSGGGDFVWTDGVYLVAGWLDHLTTPLCRPYHFSNTEYTTCTHKGPRHLETRTHAHTHTQTKQRKNPDIHAIPLIEMRGDNLPSRCRGKDRDKRGVTKWERKRAATEAATEIENEGVEWRRGELGHWCFFSSVVCSYVGHFSLQLGCGEFVNLT